MTVLAVCQFAPGEDEEENLLRLRLFAGDAAERGASLLVAPEYSAFMPGRWDPRVREHAQPLDGEFTAKLARIARRFGIALVAGMLEGGRADQAVHNTVVCIDAVGELVAVYRKVHLYDAFGFRESDMVYPGEPGQTPVVACGDAIVGIQTCFDLRFPESSRVLVDAGATVLAVPAQWMPGPLKDDHWTTLLRARAVENTSYVLAAGQSGPRGAGLSMIVDPAGVVLAATGEREVVVTAGYEISRLAGVRKTNPVLVLRRYRVVPNAGVSSSEAVDSKENAAR